MKAPIRLIEYRSDQRLEKNEYLKSLSQLNAAFAGAMELLRKYRPEAYNDKPVSKKFVNELLKNPKEVLINELTSGIKIEGLTLSPAKILELQDINLKPVIAAFKDGKKAMDICRYAKGKFELVKSKLDAALQRHIVYTQTDP